MDTFRRIFAISDIHTDQKENMEFVSSWSEDFYENDVLLLAGDVTDNLCLLEETLRMLVNKFYKVFFVPGNHELWIRHHDYHISSVEKFQHILQLCDSLNVSTKPEKITVSTQQDIWIVPMMSWYATPEDDPTDSLFHAGTYRETEEDIKKSGLLWMDNHFCKWPNMNAISKSQFFCEWNKHAIDREYDAPIISFSHFLPRVDLIPPSFEEKLKAENVRERMQNNRQLIPKQKQLTTPHFNFTRYAGCKTLDNQIREMGSSIHVYGHQHRNRDRVIDGVRYISHCLGTRREQQQGLILGLDECNGPKMIWPLYKK